LKACCDRRRRTGEIEDEGNLKTTALALKRLLVGINLLAKIVRSKKELWAAANDGLAGLGLIDADAVPLFARRSWLER